MPPEEIKRLRTMYEAQKTFLPYRYADGFGRVYTTWAEPYCRELEVCNGLTDEQGRLVVGAVNALPALLDEVEKLKRVIAEAHNIATGKAVGEFNDGDDVVAAIRTKLSEAV